VAAIALALEQELGKDRILELYVNILYFGNGVYGISDAAGFYFGKDVSALSLNQMIMLSLLPQAPTAGNPIQHPEVFERLRNRNLYLLTQREPPLITPTEEADILSRDAAHLDPELRKQDDFTRSYPQTVPMINERFGPFSGRADI
jgi:membrane peptidoglycan carboxypeptidase